MYGFLGVGITRGVVEEEVIVVEMGKLVSVRDSGDVGGVRRAEGFIVGD